MKNVPPHPTTPKVVKAAAWIYLIKTVPGMVIRGAVFLAVFAALFLIIAAMAFDYLPWWWEKDEVPAVQVKINKPKPIIYGWSMSEVESRHGPAQDKDKATGWAVWPAFRARFEGGAVVEVAVSN
jgi:hypothetical protein